MNPPALNSLSKLSIDGMRIYESIFSAVDAVEVIRRDAAAYFNIKLSKSAGIHQAQQIAHVAAAGYRPSMIGCMSESRLGITAAAHFACTCPVIRFFDLDSFLQHAEDPFQGGVQRKGGVIRLPDAPGIGAHPDPDYLRTLHEVT